MNRPKSKQSKLDAAALWEYAVRSLSVRPQSASELREKLLRRAATPRDSTEVLAKLEHYGYLDDKKMAENFASARRENQLHGKFRVLRDLQQRRIASSVARKAVESVFQGADEGELIDEFLRKKFRKIALPDYLAEPKNLASAYRRLLYAGFSSAAIGKALRRYSERVDEVDISEEPPE